MYGGEYKMTEIKEFIEIIDEGEFIRIRGQLVLTNMNEKAMKKNVIYGVAMEDIHKGQTGEIEIC